MRVRQVVLGALSCALAGAAGLLVGAQPAAAQGGGWTPFMTAPFTDPPGKPCAFGVRGDIVRDDERIRTLASNPDGTPLEQMIVGALDIRFTNLDTGASVVRDLGGVGHLRFDPDGTLELEVTGPAGVTVRAGTPGVAPGEYAIVGHFLLVLHPDGSLEIPVRQGSMENLCETLAAGS